MKIFMSLLVLCALSPLAKADYNPNEHYFCKFDESKFLPRFKSAITKLLEKEVPFEWKKDSLKISCDSPRIMEESCRVTFRAKDGRNLLVADTQSGSPEITMTGIRKRQIVDEKGKSTGSVTCTPDFYPLQIMNAKTMETVQKKVAMLEDLSYLE